MEKRNTILLTIIAIATLLVAIVGATFAYFASNIQVNNTLNVNVATSNNQAIFTAISDGNINIPVEAYMMQEGDATNGESTSSNVTIAPLLANTANINVTLQASEDGHQTKCTYDLVFEWADDSSDFTSELNGKEESTSDGVYPSKYYVRTEGLETETFKELTVEIDHTVYTGPEDEKGTNSSLVTEANIDTFTELKNGAKKLILKSGEFLTSTSATKPTKVDYQVTFRFYNLSVDQSKLRNKNFKGKVFVDNVKC